MSEELFELARHHLEDIEQRLVPARQAMDTAFNARLQRLGTTFADMRGITADGRTNDEIIQGFVRTLPSFFTTREIHNPRFESEELARVLDVLSGTVFVSLDPLRSDRVPRMPFYAVGFDERRRQALLAQPPIEFARNYDFYEDRMKEYSGALAVASFVLPAMFQRLVKRNREHIAHQYELAVEYPETIAERYDNRRGIFYVDGRSPGVHRFRGRLSNPFDTLTNYEMASYNVLGQLSRLAVLFNATEALRKTLEPIGDGEE